MARTSGSGAASAADAAPPSSGATTVTRIMEPLPKLHYCCFMGDLAGVLECITQGDSIHEALSMQNRHEQVVCGITPLFLAAQRGHTKVCKLLVENGANPNQPSYIEGSTDLCTPAEVAQLNLHLMLARYLRKAVKARRKEDAVLAQDDEDVDRARARAEEGVVDTPAPRAFMANLSDLTNWDPATGAPARLTGEKVTKMMQKQKIDLYSWKPEDERAASAMAAEAAAKKLNPSQSRVVDPTEVDVPEVQDNGKMLNKFLKDLDLQEWDPEQQGELQSRRPAGAAPSGIALDASGPASTSRAMPPPQETAVVGLAGLGGLAPIGSGFREGPGSLGGAPSSPRDLDISDLDLEGPHAYASPPLSPGSGPVSPTRSTGVSMRGQGLIGAGQVAGGAASLSAAEHSMGPGMGLPPRAESARTGPSGAAARQSAAAAANEGLSGRWKLTMGGLWNKSLKAFRGGNHGSAANNTPSSSRPAVVPPERAPERAAVAPSRPSRQGSLFTARSGSVGSSSGDGLDAGLEVSRSRVARPDDEEAEAAVLEVLRQARVSLAT